MSQTKTDIAKNDLRLPTLCVDDRRSRERFGASITLHRASAIEAGTRHGLCVIKNLSEEGAMVQTRFLLSENENVVLVMANGTRTRGLVRWIQSDFYGIQFDTLTPLSSILERECSLHVGPQRRMPRLAIAIPVLVIDSLGPKVATISDISVTGARINCPYPITSENLIIELPKHDPIKARRLWSLNDQFGCRFDQPFTINQICEWLGRVEKNLNNGMRPTLTYSMKKTPVSSL